MDETKFIDILKENNPKQMLTFLLEHGKSKKPICPVHFEPKEERKEKEDERKQ